MLSKENIELIKWVVVVVMGLVIFMSLFSDVKIENFGGALAQLYAKGPQDKHLTTYFNEPYVEFVWNNSTRDPRYPLYGIFPRYMPGTNVVPYHYLPYNQEYNCAKEQF